MSKKVHLYASAPGYDLAAKHYDDKAAFLNTFEQNRLVPLVGDLKGKMILDVGAGTGRLAAHFANLGAQVTALDVSPNMLDAIKRKNRKVVTVVGDAEDLVFPDNCFNVVVAAFLIVHLGDPRRFFDEAYRVLKDGGLLVVTNINQKDPPEIKTDQGMIVIESHYHRPERVREELEELAFAIEHEIFIKEKGVWINQIIVARK